MLDQISKAQFVEALHTNFHLEIDSTHKLDLELIEVTEKRSTQSQEQFSLLFQGPLSIQLGQNTWPLAHEQLGQLDLFLVPVVRDQQGIYYEAFFNRLLSN